MSIKKITAIIGTVVLTSNLLAQQLPQFSQFMVGDVIINPAVTGKDDYFQIRSMNRYQWIGITDAPRTFILSLNGPIQHEKMGVGGYLFTDIVGPTRRTGFYGSYAYHLKATSDINVSMGLSGGVLQYTVDGSKINMTDNSDLVISNGLQSVLLPDFGFGAFVYPANRKYYAGISVPQVLHNQLNFFDKKTTTLSLLVLHYYVTGGYKFEDLIDDITIEPSAIIKFVKPAPVQIDLGARAFYQEKIWMGIYYRSMDAVSCMVGYLHKESLSISYAYDFTTSNIRKYSTGTHELSLGIRLNK